MPYQTVHPSGLGTESEGLPHRFPDRRLCFFNAPGGADGDDAVAFPQTVEGLHAFCPDRRPLFAWFVNLRRFPPRLDPCKALLRCQIQENAQIRLTDAQCKQIEINTLMSLRETLDDETLIKAICEALDIDYEEIKDKLPEDEEMAVKGTQVILDGVNVDE